MNVLAIDTALDACSVGIAHGDPRSVVIRFEHVVRGHAERLFALVGEALTQAGLAIPSIERFAVTIGPGSFTGIRVGVAAVRGFALVTGAPAIGISTLAAFAEAARNVAGQRPVLAVMPAKGGEVFCQFFGADGEPLSAPEVSDPARLISRATEVDAVLAGPAAEQLVKNERWKQVGIANAASSLDIDAVLSLAERAAVDAPPKPLYIKPPDAVASAGAVARQ